MSDGKLKIGKELVDMNDPRAMAVALQKVRIRLSAGQLRETVRMDGEEVTFMRANLTELKRLIAEYESKCPGPGGLQHRRRFAKRVRFN